MARVSFGLRGMWLPLFFQLISNVVFVNASTLNVAVNANCHQFGLQAVYGGQAIGLMLGAIIPRYRNMRNTLPAGAGTTTKDLLGFLLYVFLYLPVVIWIRPHKLEKFMWPTFIATITALFGIMAWAVVANGGSAGNLITPVMKLSAADRGFRFVQCISTVSGVYGSAADRFSDWTRFSRNKNSYILGSVTAMPVVITLCGFLGVLTASATKARYGHTMWQPLVILNFAQQENYTASSRAATFFAGLAIWSHQVFVNVSQNNVGAGMYNLELMSYILLQIRRWLEER